MYGSQLYSSVIPSAMVLLSEVSVRHSQLQPENIKWKIQEIIHVLN
jgi:hypothetical protein